jgi:hypothetical protein
VARLAVYQCRLLSYSPHSGYRSSRQIYSVSSSGGVDHSKHGHAARSCDHLSHRESLQSVVGQGLDQWTDSCIARRPHQTSWRGSDVVHSRQAVVLACLDPAAGAVSRRHLDRECFRIYVASISEMFGNCIRRLECIWTFHTDDGFLFFIENKTKRCQSLMEFLT